MRELFKNIYSKSFYEEFSGVAGKALPSFAPAEFMKLIFNDAFDGYELKERMLHTAQVLHHFLPNNFHDAATGVENCIDALRRAGIREKSVEFMFFPEYIAMYGIGHCDRSISAFEFITQFTSCEFAVRPYIVKYEKKMLRQLSAWSKHDNYLVRRLASEGSRPRLPWAMALPRFKGNPAPLLPILNHLKRDHNEIVRRSVANSLNDISKDNPEFAIAVATDWKGLDDKTDALIKHACRTLLKQGHPEILRLFGFFGDCVTLSDVRIHTPAVRMGGALEFSFSVCNASNTNQRLRLEYGLYYKKKNGTLSKKVFTISERSIAPNQRYSVKKTQSFKRITTRTFYVGTHQLSIIANGKENNPLSFELIR